MNVVKKISILKEDPRVTKLHLVIDETNDNYMRDWNIFELNTPKEAAAIVYDGRNYQPAPILTGNSYCGFYDFGVTMTLPSGLYCLIIGVAPEYGTYRVAVCNQQGQTLQTGNCNMTTPLIFTVP
jgi:hypothetical protein